MVNANGNGGSIKIGSIAFPISALGILVVLMLTVANDASVALNLIELQQKEISLVRTDVATLRGEVNVYTSSRYSSRDAERDLAYLQRQVDEIKDYIKTHRRESSR